MDPFQDLHTIEEVDRLFERYKDAGEGEIYWHAANRRKLDIHYQELAQRRRDMDEEGINSNDTGDSQRLYYEVRTISIRNANLFKTQARDYMLRIDPEAFQGAISFNDYISRIYRVFEGVIQDLLGHLPDHAYARFVILPDVENDVDEGALHSGMSTSYQPVRYITAELVMSLIENVAQSKRSFIMNNKMKIHVLSTVPPEGNGRKTDCIPIREKKCVFSVCTYSNNCLGEAIVFGIHSHEKPGRNTLQDLKKCRKKLGSKVQMIHEQAQVPMKDTSYGLKHVQTFQKYLEGKYQIVVISSNHQNMPVYTGVPGKNKIYLYHSDDHYDLITNIHNFFGKDNTICTVCWEVHPTRRPHYKCEDICRMCYAKGCKAALKSTPKSWCFCEKCGRYFPSKQCFSNHLKKEKKNGESVCSVLCKCDECGKVIARKNIKKNNHQCGLVYCTICKDYTNHDHMCYVKSIDDDLEKDTKKWGKNRVFYYDFETDSSTGEHKPVMVAFSDEFGKEKHHFWGESCLDKFCKHILRNKYKNTIWIAHNGGRFDMYFLLQYIFDIGEKPDVVYNGSTLMKLYLPKRKITFKDSFLYLPRALSALPKMFGVADAAKTFFPHLLSFSEHSQYVGQYPPPESYGVDCMSTQKRSECISWLQMKTESNEIFEYKKNMIEYCVNDVEVLRLCGEKFRQLFRDQGHIDPFIDGMTLSQNVSYVYRKLHMPLDSIGIIPPWGYRNVKRYSVKGINWLDYLTKKTGIQINHARNGGEIKLDDLGIYVDGYAYPMGVKTLKGHVFEMAGCMYHGCDKCFSPKTVNPITGKPMQQHYEEHMERKARIINSGYKYTEIWEHEYDELAKKDELLNDIVQKSKYVSPLSPKDCLYGGRTEVFTLFKKAKHDESIRYIDVNSLYPYVQRSKLFPEGHPEIMINPDKNDFDKWFGLVKAEVIPPKNLFLPVLPLRSGGKLLFPLCSTCSQQNLNSECTHTESERSWVGSYTTVEMTEALKQGYKLGYVYEVWNWPNEQRTKHLFTEFVNTFLKIKYAGAGFPKENMSSDEKLIYVNEIKKRENIELTVDEITDNPGLRALGKLCLNSLWGKFCQELEKAKTEYVTKPKDFFNILLNETNIVKSVNIVSDTMLELVYTSTKDFVMPNAFTNYVLGAFVTSYARLHLYNYMKMFGQDVIYCDTDSLVYLERSDSPNVELGPYLGQMSDEIYSTHKVNDVIDIWVATGPKSYGYKLRDNDEIQNVKCKGITLNHTTSSIINFDHLLNIVVNTEKRTESVKVQYPNFIKRDRKKVRVCKTTMVKSFSFTFNKRRIMHDNFTTQPFGYVN